MHAYVGTKHVRDGFMPKPSLCRIVCLNSHQEQVGTRRRCLSFACHDHQIMGLGGKMAALSSSGTLDEILARDINIALPWDIFTAASLGETEAVKSLLAARTDEGNRTNHAGWTPLIYAAR